MTPAVAVSGSAWVCGWKGEFPTGQGYGGGQLGDGTTTDRGTR